MYKPGNNKSWSGRVDELDGIDGFRWHQIIRPLDLGRDISAEIEPDKTNIALLGFACDEGVRRNKGRTGSAKGPHELRKALANLAVHFDDNVRLYDAGDVICLNEDLEAAQSLLAQQVAKLHRTGFFPVLLGGGHEIAYAHYSGIVSASAAPPPAIVNLDAHFDLRTFEEKGNSGTPFLQIATDCQKAGHPFSYLVIGIQQASNTRALFKTAERLDVQYVTGEQVIQNRAAALQTLDGFLAGNDSIYLTICLDVIAASFAPGVSAPALNGIFPNAALDLVERIVQSNKVISCDVAELNPEYDIDGRTARLAAALIFNMVTGAALH